MIRKMLKFRLPVTKSTKYIKWLKSRNKNLDFHHIIGRKTTDYLGVLLIREEHQKRHKNVDECFDEDLLEAINNLIEYVKYLENY